MKTKLFFSVLCASLVGFSVSGSETETATRIKGALIFPTPIVWVGDTEPPTADSARLLEAIGIVTTGGSKQGLNALEAFITANPESPWTPSLLVHLAEHYRNTGRYSLALADWQSAWAATKNRNDARSRAVASQAVAGWTRLLGSLGRKEEQAALFTEAKSLKLDQGAQAITLQATLEGHEKMKRHPEIAYRCGSFALAEVVKNLQPAGGAWTNIYAQPSREGGFKLSELVDLSIRNDCPMVAVRRESGDTLVVPSVIHWQLDHYAAIVERKDNYYLVIDPTFGGKKWLEADVINAEASGNFLVAATNRPAGWQLLSQEVAATIHGKGYPNDQDPTLDNNGDDEEPSNCPPPPPPTPGDGPGGGEGDDDCPPDDPGMPQWRVSEPFISLWLEDTPLYYRSSAGPVTLKLSYNHRGLAHSPSLAGFGDNWECNWIGFLERQSGMIAYITNNLAGGGKEAYPVDSGGASIPGNRSYDGSRELSIDGSPANASIHAPTAQQNGYGSPIYSPGIIGSTRFFLTNRVDAYGRTTSFSYTSNYINFQAVIRLILVTDKDGKQCTLDYTNTSYPNLITSVTDPYLRSAYFEYDDHGRLTNITDMAGMPSSFMYDDADNSITNLHTPYGDTGFRYFAGTNALNDALSRAIEISEPLGFKQLYAYHDLSPDDVANFDTFENCCILYRNSYHWNRQQYAALSDEGKTNVLELSTEDCNKASLKHWLHGLINSPSSTVINTLGATAGPLTDPDSGQRANQVAYAYEGQTNYSQSGTSKRIAAVRWSQYEENSLQIIRNQWGRPTQILRYHYPTWVGYTNEFNSDGRILQRVWGPKGELLRGYGYDATLTNLLTSVTNALGEVIRYTYDAAAHVTSVTEPSGLVVTNYYYTSGAYAGFLRESVVVGIRTNSYSYENGNRLVHTNELGLVTTNTWDGLNRLTSRKFPDGTTISNVYDATKKLSLVAQKDRMNHWTYYGYNALRQLTSVTNANGQVTLYDYCDCGSPGTITHLNGSIPLQTHFQYDLAGRRTNVTYADGYYQNYSYGQYGWYWATDRDKLVRVVDPSGVAAHFEYIDGQVAKIGLSHAGDYADGYLLERTFDVYERLVSEKNRDGITVTNGYDVLGRVTNRVTLDNYSQPNSTNLFTYTARGLTNSTDELGYKTWYVYDAAGRLLSQTNANNEALQFTYDPADHMLTLKDGKNQTTAWNYDQYGRPTNKLDAVREIFRYVYDADDRLTNRWTAEKGDTFYGYDPLGNLTNVDYPGTLMDLVLKYDLMNRLTNVTDLIGSTKFSYSDAGQLLSEDGPWADDTVSYTYDARRRVGLAIAQPNATPWAQTYGYNQYNMLTNVTSPAGAFAYLYYSYAYGANLFSDRIYSQGLPGNYGDRNFTVNSFDSMMRLTDTKLYGYAGGVLRNQHSYEYDAASQRTQQTFMADTVGNYVDYTYDPIGQLKTAKGWEYGGSVSRLNEQFGYAYDAAWNLQRRTNNALVQTFGVNTLNELTNATRSGTLTVAGVASQPGANLSSVSVSVNGGASGNADVYADGSWAKSGATLANGANTYSATATDTYGRTAADSLALNLPATNTFSYDYNGNLTNDGQRVFQYDYENQLTNVYVASAWKSEFKYDAFGRRRTRKEYGWSGSAWTLTNEVRYVYDGMLVVQERDAKNLALVSYTRGNDLSASLQGAGGIGGLLARTDNGRMIAGDPSAHAYYHCDGNGNITALVDTNGFLVARYQYDPYGNLLGMSGPLADANTYRFSSKEWCANSGLYYYGYRFYEPNLQRWLNRDLLEERGGINLYGYVGNVQSGWLVPYGLCWYNPLSWDWDKIGSGVEGKLGLKPGLEAKLKGPVGLGLNVGGSIGLGAFTNLGGDKYGRSGIYTGGSIGIKATAGQGSFGLSKEKGVKLSSRRGDDSGYVKIEPTDQVVRGWKVKGAGDGAVKGVPYKPWKIGAEAAIVAVEVGLSVDFGTICDGIVNSK